MIELLTSPFAFGVLGFVVIFIASGILHKSSGTGAKTSGDNRVAHST
ncbi:MAG: hypothetical protein ACR2RB_17505 [Gammaproteobacteria bacterium]